MISKSAEETKKIAAKLSRKLHGGEVIALCGELGSGKTTFVQGLAKALGIKEPITSPTFVLMKEYPINLTPGVRFNRLIHIDLYRIRNEKEAKDLGLRDFFGQKNKIVIIEWAEKAKGLLPKNTIWIKFSHIGKDKRKIEIK